jgi:hypothetical protein
LSIDGPEAVGTGQKKGLHSVAGAAGELFPAFCVKFVDIFFEGKFLAAFHAA